MLKKIIMIENGEEFQCNTLEEATKELIDENYYEISETERKSKMKMKAMANCLNNRFEIVEDISNTDESLDRKFIIKDEMTYILSLLLTNNIILLERVDSNIFTKELNKQSFEDNYVIVNKFAKELLSKYLER